VFDDDERIELYVQSKIEIDMQPMVQKETEEVFHFLVKKPRE
jgi:hypothetical protein